jgi:drug/metabolite transporter (DMT)-like permease
MTARALAAPSERPLLGIGLMLLAVLSFTCLDAIAKYGARDASVAMLVWGRYAFNLLFMSAFLPWLGVGGLVRTARPIFQAVRAVMLVLATVSMFMAVKLLPLAETYAISFVSPLIVAALSAPTLGERVGGRQWVAIFAGFAGVLIVIRPGEAALGWVAVYPLLMATFYAIYQIMTRVLRTSDGPVPTLFYTVLVGSLAMSAVLPVFWETPLTETLGLMAAMGALGLCGQLMLIKALSLAPASLISPFVYTQIIWAGAIGYLVFGDVPDAATLLGALIVVASGTLLLFWRHSMRSEGSATRD